MDRRRYGRVLDGFELGQKRKGLSAELVARGQALVTLFLVIDACRQRIRNSGLLKPVYQSARMYHARDEREDPQP